MQAIDALSKMFCTAVPTELRKRLVEEVRKIGWRVDRHGVWLCGLPLALRLSEGLGISLLTQHDSDFRCHVLAKELGSCRVAAH